MKKILLLAIFLFCFAPTIAWSKDFISLPVPFTPEDPDGKMIKPWNNSCEEASIVMADNFYQGKTTLAKSDAKKQILNYINTENKIFGYNANVNAAEIAQVVNEYSPYFSAAIKTDPALAEIKSELDAGHPVISLHYGRDLNNPHHIFLRTGSYYHTMIIVGYDDSAREFITNDNGDFSAGLDYRYKYDTIMGTLRDYSHKLKKTVYPATVIFTSQRRLVKTVGSNRIYLIKDNQKHYITSPQVFKDNKWKWAWVQTVKSDWLTNLPSAPAI